MDRHSYDSGRRHSACSLARTTHLPGLTALTAAMLFAGCGTSDGGDSGAGGSAGTGGAGGGTMCKIPLDCNDENPCTENLCDLAEGTCSNPIFTNGTICSGEESPGKCVAGVCIGLCEFVGCGDGNDCTEELCDPADGSCLNPPVSDGTVCDAGGDPGQCSSGLCVGLCADADCDDGKECTEDLCDRADGSCNSLERPDGSACDLVGLPGRCMSGTCIDAALCREVDCSDGNECTEDVCNATTAACTNPNKVDGAFCETDGNPGLCSAGLCQGLCEGVSCEDGNPCTVDTCDPSNASCPNPDTAEGTPCDYGDLPGKCSSGLCVGLCAGVVCNDHNQCTSDACDSSAGVCIYTVVADGTACGVGGLVGMCISGTCDPSVFACTEEGIREAIARGGGPYTFACDGPATVTTQAEIVIDNDVILDGEGNLVVDGNDSHRVFSVPVGITAELRGMTTTNGNGAFVGGGFYTAGTLTLTDCSILRSHSAGAGGIHNDYGTLSLIRSAVTQNVAAGFAAAGIHNLGGTVTLSNSVVSGNDNPNDRLGPGGIMNESRGESIATLTLIDSVVSDNTSSGSGGGISNVGPGPFSTVTLIRTAIAGNASALRGGGISNEGLLAIVDSIVSGNSTTERNSSGGGISNNHTLTITDSIISGNSGRYHAGGIWNSGRLDVTGSTVSGNAALGGIGTGGGIANTAFGELTMTNSTVSENTAYRGAGITTGGGLTTLTNVTIAENSSQLYSNESLYGDHSAGMQVLLSTLVDGRCNFVSGATMVSSGGNIESPGDTCRFNQPTDLANVTAAALNLGPLADNGGPTETHSLLPGSVAIDLIPAEDCETEEDQRDEARPETGGSMCDVGAFEMQP